VALREVRLEHEAPTDGYPLCLPAVRALPLQLADTVTVLVGENGSGKSTLVEAIAIAAGFNPEGGSFQVRDNADTLTARQRSPPHLVSPT
jgi:predicted ATPase